MIRLTGLWLNEKQDGRKYLRGNLNATTRLFVFPNEHKQRETDPDYYVCLTAREKSEQTEPQHDNQAQQDDSDAGGVAEDAIPF